MVADGLTKALARDRHHDLMQRMGLERVGASNEGRLVGDKTLRHHQSETRKQNTSKSGSVGISKDSEAETETVLPFQEQ